MQPGGTEGQRDCLTRERALRVSWFLHLAAAALLAHVGGTMLTAAPVVAVVWAVVAALAFVAVCILFYLEQRWAEDVNLAFFTTNVWVGFVVLAFVLALRFAGGGF